MILDRINPKLITRWLDLHGSTLYVYSAIHLDQRLEEFKQLMHTQKIQGFYAIKANSNLTLLKRILKSGFGFDVVSGGELQKVILAGAKPSQIVFSGVGKTDEELSLALRHKIFSIHIESIEEWKRCCELQKKLKIGSTQAFAFRFNPDVNSKTHPYISTALKENKFGLQATDILNFAKSVYRPNQSMLWKGLSIHLGSQIHSKGVFKEGFSKLHQLADRLNSKFNLGLERLDLGGGIGVSETPSAGSALHLKDYARIVELEFGSKTQSLYKLMFEPGRRVIGESGVLVSRVIDIKERSSTRPIVIVDAAMNDYMRCALYQAKPPMWFLGKGKWQEVQHKPAKSQTRTSYFDIAGPVCESADMFAKGVASVEMPKRGDLFCIGQAGAYGMSMASDYNLRPKRGELLILDTLGNKTLLIRKPQTLTQLLENEPNL